MNAQASQLSTGYKIDEALAFLLAGAPNLKPLRSRLPDMTATQKEELLRRLSQGKPGIASARSPVVRVQRRPAPLPDVSLLADCDVEEQLTDLLRGSAENWPRLLQGWRS